MNIRLLYSKYQPQDGLMVVAYYHKLFQEAITDRNQLVAASFEIAKEGFEHALNEFTPDLHNVAGTQDFLDVYKRQAELLGIDNLGLGNGEIQAIDLIFQMSLCLFSGIILRILT